jgi:hypothetical protein
VIHARWAARRPQLHSLVGAGGVPPSAVAVRSRFAIYATVVRLTTAVRDRDSVVS